MRLTKHEILNCLQCGDILSRGAHPGPAVVLGRLVRAAQDEVDGHFFALLHQDGTVSVASARELVCLYAARGKTMDVDGALRKLADRLATYREAQSCYQNAT